MTTQRDDQGFSLIELLLVIVILGILAVVVAFSVGGLTSEASSSGCQSDAQTLYTATEAFFAQRDTDTIPAFDGSVDAYEMTLVNERFLRSTSRLHNVDAAGKLTPAAGSSCTP